MTSERQLSVFPERANERWSPLHGLEPITGELTDFADGVEAQIGDLMLLEIGPDRFNRIEFGGVGGQVRNRDMFVQLFQPGVDLAAAMDCRAIPDDQQRFFDLTLERTEKFDDLLGANCARKEAKVELRKGQTGNGRELLPGKLCWRTGVCPRRLHVRATLGRSHNPDSSMKTMVRSSRWAFF